MNAAALAVCPVGTSVRAALGVAQVEPGNVVLITGAGGGLGLHQIQVVKSVNAHAIAVTSSEEKAEIVRQAGADEVIVSPDLKFSGEVWRRTGKQGVDVVLENVVTDTFGESLRSTAQNAMVVVLGNIGTKRVEIDPGLIIARRIRIAGSGNATYKDVQIALHLLATKAVKPFIGRVLPFPQAWRRPRPDGAARGDRPRRSQWLVRCTSAQNWRSSRAAFRSHRHRRRRRDLVVPAISRAHHALRQCAARARACARATGSRCSIPDIREYLEVDYGTMAAGFVRVPMDPRLTRRELDRFAAPRRRARAGHACVLRRNG